MALLHGKKVEFTFPRTTIIGSSVFFKGKTLIHERLLDQYKQIEADKVRKAAELENQVGMTATEASARVDIPRNAGGLRLDGPTPEAWVKAGYKMEHYPPTGYAAKSPESEGVDENAVTAAQVLRDE